MPVMKIHGADLFYAAGGADTDLSLVLIHGSGATHESYPPELFSIPGARVIAPDLPGHGQSQGPFPESVAGYAEVVSGLVAALRLSKVVVMGHSLGGAVCLTLCLQKPGWLKGAVLMGTGARLRVNPMIIEGLSKDYLGAVSMMDSFLFASEAPAELRETSRDHMKKADPQAVINDFRACNAFDVMARLSEIAVPCQVISADQDVLTAPKYGQYLADHIPGAVHSVIQGAGHMMAVEKPGEVTGIVESFLARLSA
ncbi:MAG: alpha/beta hydrolase [Thermodesulfobacteriota bacterium]